MSTCNYTQQIAASECIGDSLVKINNNFSNLDNSLCTAVQDIANFNNSLNNISAIPAAAIMTFYRTAAPTGWLICNGVTIPNGTGTVQGQTANFAALYALTGATVPDLRGLFVRSFDERAAANGSRDPDRNGGGFGAYQTDAYKAHTHGYTGAERTNASVSGYTGNGLYVSKDKNTSSVGGTETRPKNIALLYCIKY